MCDPIMYDLCMTYACRLLLMLAATTDKLSETLKALKLSGVEGHEIAMLTVKTLETL